MSMRSILSRLSFLTVGATLVGSIGCGNFLTPDQVREHLDNPKATVSKDNVGFATDDFFRTKRASNMENAAFFLKNTEGSENGAAGWAASVVEQGAMEDAVRYSGAGIGDIFCAANLITSISSFDSCSSGQNCEAKFTLDSCVLRIGDNGDNAANGKIEFLIKNSANTDFNRTELRLTFDAFEHSNGSAVDFASGILALETTDFLTQPKQEVLLSTDVDVQTRLAPDQRGFLSSGVVTRSRASAALRLSTEELADGLAGSLEILAFVDDNANDRQESVALRINTTSREVENQDLATLTLEVVGANGTFSCNFNSAEESLSDSKSTYHSVGSCTDPAGETFSFDSTTTVEEG